MSYDSLNVFQLSNRPPNQNLTKNFQLSLFFQVF